MSALPQAATQRPAIRTAGVLAGRPCSVCGTARRGPRVQPGGDVHQRCAARTPCSLCGRRGKGLLLDAGGSLGLVHVRCFRAWDRAAEASDATLPLSVEPRCA